VRPAGARSQGARPFEGLSLLDVGCGGGLIAEPMRRMGFSVTAIDASSENIGTARAHADMVGLEIAYRAATVEQIEAEGAGPFDVVLTMEVIEHVADPEAFVRACSRLVRPGGVMMVATLNRTLKSLALGKVAAEYILRWVPAGTHDWRQFLKPDEIRTMLAQEAVTVEGPYGLNYDPLTRPLEPERRRGHQLYDGGDADGLAVLPPPAGEGRRAATGWGRPGTDAPI
jgi:2-polyprenyl-6-hydroxyphenyl methylase / 3-demethylubiquinone-9 3-methyltransferase